MKNDTRRGQGIGVRETGDGKWVLTWDVVLGWIGAAIVIVIELAKLASEILKGGG